MLLGGVDIHNEHVIEVSEALMKLFQNAKGTRLEIDKHVCANMLIYAARLLEGCPANLRGENGLQRYSKDKQYSKPDSTLGVLLCASNALYCCYGTTEQTLDTVFSLFHQAPLSWKHIRVLISTLPTPALWATFLSLAHNTPEEHQEQEVSHTISWVLQTTSFTRPVLAAPKKTEEMPFGHFEWVLTKHTNSHKSTITQGEAFALCEATAAFFDMEKESCETRHKEAARILLHIYNTLPDILCWFGSSKLSWLELSRMAYHLPRHVFWLIAFWLSVQAGETRNAVCCEDMVWFRQKKKQQNKVLWGLGEIDW